MELRDLIVTPIVVLLVLAAAYYIRPRVTDENTRRYFFPALLVKIFGAIALGFIYQYYYSGGDTYNFHTHGSRHIWNAFVDDPMKGLKLMFGLSDSMVGLYQYTSRIIFWNDPNSNFVIRIAAILDMFTFSSYSATAVLFSTLGFSGAWMLFVTFYKQYPNQHKGLAIASLFIPSVFFWGSGILKDTLVLAALGATTYFFYCLVIERKNQIISMLAVIFLLYVIFNIKKFVLQAYVPAILVWIVALRMGQLNSAAFRILIRPILILVTALSGYWAITKIGEGDERYAVDKLAATARITAYDIRFWTGRDAGSGYSLGELDGTFQGMVALAPAAINVSLFRPYIWEVKNPLMLLSALESLTLLVITILIFFRVKFQVFVRMMDPNILFCLVFSLSFAFAVGISTFNFGTLSRYKIPLLPFFCIALVLLSNQVNNSRNLDTLADTE